MKTVDSGLGCGVFDTINHVRAGKRANTPQRAILHGSLADVMKVSDKTVRGKVAEKSVFPPSRLPARGNRPRSFRQAGNTESREIPPGVGTGEGRER